MKQIINAIFFIELFFMNVQTSHLIVLSIPYYHRHAQNWAACVRTASFANKTTTAPPKFPPPPPRFFPRRFRRFRRSQWLKIFRKCTQPRESCTRNTNTRTTNIYTYTLYEHAHINNITTEQIAKPCPSSFKSWKCPPWVEEGKPC